MTEAVRSGLKCMSCHHTILIMELGRNKMQAHSPDIERSIATGKSGNERAWVFSQRIKRQLKSDVTRNSKDLKQVDIVVSNAGSGSAQGDCSG